MIVFKNSIRNISNMISKHKMLSLLMVAFVTISLLVLGFTVNVQQITEEKAQEYDERYGEMTFYYTGEGLSDNTYYRYLDEENNIDYQKLLTFKNKLSHSDSFTYTEIIQQHLELISPVIPSIFLVGYESGDSNYSIFEYDGNVLYATKAIEVSPSFFNEFSIGIAMGSAFSEDDYLYKEESEIPILVGNAYKEYFELDDKFEGYYLTEIKTFVIKGFIEEQTFFYSRSVNDFVSCERYIIIPSLKTNDISFFSKTLLLQQMSGMISSTLGYQQTLEIYNQYLKESGIEDWSLYVVNPDAEKFSITDTYSAMTNEVAHQFNILVIIVLLFGCMTMVTVICGLLKENHYTFGVSLLCGASFRNIAFEAVGLVGGIVLLGDLLASSIMLLQNFEPISLLIVQIVAITISVIACIACVLYLYRMDVSDIIGGKE